MIYLVCKLQNKIRKMHPSVKSAPIGAFGSWAAPNQNFFLPGNGVHPAARRQFAHQGAPLAEILIPNQVV